MKPTHLSQGQVMLYNLSAATVWEEGYLTLQGGVGWGGGVIMHRVILFINLFYQTVSGLGVEVQGQNLEISPHPYRVGMLLGVY